MMESGNNVIAFPKLNPRMVNVSPLQEKLKELEDEADDDIRQQYAMLSVDNMRNQIIDLLVVNGFDISDKKKIKDLALAVETIKSYILKSYEIYHPLQSLSEEMFLLRKDGMILLKINTLHKIMKTDKHANT